MHIPPHLLLLLAGVLGATSQDTNPPGATPYGIWPLVTPLLNVRKECFDASVEYIWGLNNSLPWALQMLDSSGPLPFLQEGLLSDTQAVPIGEYLCGALPAGLPCPEPIAQFALHVPFGYGTGQGSQEGCTSVQDFSAHFCHNALIPITGGQFKTTKTHLTPKQFVTNDARQLDDSEQRLIKRILKDYRPDQRPESLTEIPTVKLPDPLKLVKMLERQNPAVMRLIQNASEEIKDTFASICPECKEEVFGPDKLLMLYALLWGIVNSGNGGGSALCVFEICLPGYRSCYPSACSKADMNSNSAAFGYLHGVEIQGEKNFLLGIHEVPFDDGPDYLPGCTSDERYNGVWKTENTAIVTIFAILGALLVAGTVYDVHSRTTGKKTSWHDSALAFSLLTNFEFVVSTKQGGGDRLGCLEGIRALSMTWVVLGHSFLFSANFMFINNKQYTNPIQSQALEAESGLAFRAIVAGPYSVDTFFFIGATLVSYLLHKDLDKTKGWANMEGFIHMVLLYVNRVLRITIPYALMILFMIGIPPIVITEPIAAIGYAQNAAHVCSKYWWRHLLYINNFNDETGQNPGEGCIGQSWFLGTDMMFFAASPLIIYPLWLSKFGRVHKVSAYLWWLLFPALSVGWYFRCVYGGVINGGLSEEALAEFCWTDIITNTDFAPWGRRCQGYIMGLLAGHILHATKGKKINISPFLNLVIWQAVLALFFALVYAPYHTILETGVDEPIQKFWFSCSHLLWGLCLTWLVFACCRGLGGVVNDLLSWPGWIPISKISFMTYLCHMDFNWFFFLMQVWFTHTKSKSSALLLQDYNVDWTMLLNVQLFLGNLAVALFCGMLLSLSFELPFAKLQKILITSLVKAITGPKKRAHPLDIPEETKDTK